MIISNEDNDNDNDKNDTVSSRPQITVISSRRYQKDLVKEVLAVSKSKYTVVVVVVVVVVLPPFRINREGFSSALA